MLFHLRNYYRTSWLPDRWEVHASHVVMRLIDDKTLSTEDLLRYRFLLNAISVPTSWVRSEVVLGWRRSSQRQKCQYSVPTAIKRLLTTGEIERRLQTRGWYRWYEYRLVVTKFTNDDLQSK